MGLDWSTFLLEVVNFLILIWILKRFLYAPVKAAIEERRQRVEAVLEEAHATRADAEGLRADYEARMEEWEATRARARGELEQEMAAERARRMEEVEREIGRRREQAEALEAKQRRDAERLAEETALDQGAAFAARLLGRTADPALERRLVETALEDMASLGEEQRAAMARATGPDAPPVRVQSAFPIGADQRRAIESALAETAQGEIRCAFEQDPGLIAGLRIDAGSLVMSANLRDELRFFAEAGR
jgi:F-type H+-transporting ATPase subunit b